MHEFDAEIVSEDRLVYAHVPFDAKEAFGIKKGPLYVRGEVNGCLYRTKLIPKGNGRQIIVLNKELQNTLEGKGVMLHFSMEADIQYGGKEQRDDVHETSGMDVIHAVTGRRSIRKYKAQAVDQSIISTILNAGFCAPSATNKRPWHFIVIRDKDTLSMIASAGQYTKMIADAPLCIAVCGDRNVQGKQEFLYEDCAAAVQNMLLCAHALGLGAVWCGVTSGSQLRKSVIEQLKLPVKIIPVALVAAGYPDEQKEPEPRYESAKVHFECW